MITVSEAKAELIEYSHQLKEVGCNRVNGIEMALYWLDRGSLALACYHIGRQAGVADTLSSISTLTWLRPEEDSTEMYRLAGRLGGLAGKLALLVDKTERE